MSMPPDQFPPESSRSAALALHQPHMLQTAVLRGEPEEQAEEVFTLRDLYRMVLKHKWMLLAVALLCTVVSTLYGLRETPMYRATVVMQIDKTAPRIVQFNRDVEAQEYYDDGTFLQTQIELLRSRSLAERVIDDLGLDPNKAQAQSPVAFGALPGASAATPAPGAAEVAGAPKAAANLMEQLLANYRQVSTPSVSDRQILNREGVVGGFLGALTVTPVPNSKLVRINVAGSDPAQAARIANAIAKTYIAVTIERRSESSNYARTFLEDQIRQTKAKLEESERHLNNYARSNSILNLDDKTNVVNQNFSEYSSALARAEQERIKAESLYNQIALNPASALLALESKTIQAYKEQKAKIEAEYMVNLSTYKPDFPKMVQMKAQIDEIDSRIKAEVGTVLGSLKAQYEAAKRQEEQVRARLAESRKEVLVTQDRSVDLNLLKRELDTNRQLYDGLLQRLKEVGVTGDVTPTNISVVDEARTPLFPFSPQPMRNATMGLGLGLLLGIAIIFLREHLDDSIKHADEIEGLFGLPLLGWIPLAKKKMASGESPAMMSHEEPRSPFAEAYRSMRTALQFSTTEGAPKRFMVTSCGKNEGKTTTALALAINFAQLGKQVLLIDADMRNPSVHKALKIPNEMGLSNFLSGDLGREKLIQKTGIPNLYVLPSGPTPPNPVELLMGPKLVRLLDKAEELGYSQVVIDGPPLLGIADAVVLGNQIQYIVFAVKAASTRKSSIKDSLRRLRNAGLAPMGVVLTHARGQHTHDYAYETYYGYGGYYKDDKGAGRAVESDSGTGMAPDVAGKPQTA
jgi:capsular exopolysaccharide synthesis family protein